MAGPFDESPPDGYYEIVESPTYAEQVAELGLDARELDEKLSELLFVVARVPNLFSAVSGTNLRVAHHEGDPLLRIWFTYEGHQVTLHGIERLDFP